MEDAEPGRDKALERLRLENLRFAGQKPFCVDASIDDHGYSWLTGHYNYASDDPYAVPTAMMVLRPVGEYLGDTAFRSPFSTVSRGHLLTVNEDQETGEMDYIAYRIVSAIPGFEYP